MYCYVRCRVPRRWPGWLENHATRIRDVCSGDVESQGILSKCLLSSLRNFLGSGNTAVKNACQNPTLLSFSVSQGRQKINQQFPILGIAMKSNNSEHGRQKRLKEGTTLFDLGPEVNKHLDDGNVEDVNTYTDNYNTLRGLPRRDSVGA